MPDEQQRELDKLIGKPEIPFKNDDLGNITSMMYSDKMSKESASEKHSRWDRKKYNLFSRLAQEELDKGVRRYEKKLDAAKQVARQANEKVLLSANEINKASRDIKDMNAKYPIAIEEKLSGKRYYVKSSAEAKRVMAHVIHGIQIKRIQRPHTISFRY